MSCFPRPACFDISTLAYYRHCAFFFFFFFSYGLQSPQSSYFPLSIGDIVDKKLGKKDMRVDLVDRMDRSPREDLVGEEAKNDAEHCVDGHRGKRRVLKPVEHGERGQGKGTSCPENICRNKRKIKLGYCITSRHIMSMSLWNRNVCVCVVLFVMR